MKTDIIRIGGMTCVNCQNRIEKMLKSMAGVDSAEVDWSAGTAAVAYNDDVVTLAEITDAIEQLGYTVGRGKQGASGGASRVSQIAGTVVIILALFMLLQGMGVSVLSRSFPLAEAGMGYGMLFLIGLITSVHCIAMCGGINLSQTLRGNAVSPPSKFTVLFPSILYNGGRVISYTVVGIFVGVLGSVISVSGRFQGVVQLAAGVFMVIMGINMLGIFGGAAGSVLRRLNLRVPKIFARNIDAQKASGKNPLIIGLLNGLMPCGPLQAMQLYALSTGSAIAGGVSMFLFSAGTVPLMFGLGALSSFLSSAKGRGFSRRVMSAGAILVTVMGLTMLSNGWSLSGFNLNIAERAAAFMNPAGARRGTAASAGPVIENGKQIVNSTLSGGRYPAITVQAGIPVKWTINAPAGSINGCNNRMIIREYGIEHSFTPGDNVVEFTPTKTGKFAYSCWMGMIRSSITVAAVGQSAAVEPNLAPSPAGVAIPTDNIALAELAPNGTRGEWQRVTINLRDDGISPAIIVVQRGVPAAWIINNDSLDAGNSRLIVPAYFTELEMDQGDNVIQLMPETDFDFSTADYVFYGYVKVVDDITAVDAAAIEAIKKEVSNFETMIYPDEYFEARFEGASGGCCGGA